MDDVMAFGCCFVNVFPVEKNESFSFIWTQSAFRISFDSAVEYGFILDIHVPCENNEVLVSSDCGNISLHTNSGWNRYPVFLKSLDGQYEVNVKKHFVPGDGDTRCLGMCIRDVKGIDKEKFDELKWLEKKRENAYGNRIEYEQGKEILSYYPTQLAIATEDRCNIGERQPCAYCDYKWAIRDAKKHPRKLLSMNNLDDYGDFLRYSDKVVDCSIGEPFMNKDFISIIEKITTDKKLSFTTNGQFFVEKNIQALLGKDIDMYISIDAADAEMYSHYRNDKFDDIITNLRRLCSLKKEHNNLPIVYVSFIVMNSNKRIVRQWVKLMHDIGVDVLILARLNKAVSQDAAQPIMKNGYEFIYENEVISDDDYDVATEEAQKEADKLGMKLINRSQHFIDIPQNGAPICSDPWKSAYLLSKGISPCCYGSIIASWSQKPNDMSYFEYAKSVFNGEQMKDIRKHLAKGEFSSYCLSIKSCPIVDKYLGEVKSIDIGTDSGYIKSVDLNFTK